MRYYHYEQTKKMEAKALNWKLDGILQKNFPDNNKWGACVAFDKNNKVDFIEINKLSDLTLKGGSTWTHYATIGVYKSKDANNGKYWELYSQFNGKDENELWVFAYYKNFGDAVRRVKLGIENLKPIKIY
mgnify:CR=1 FL=1